jgi:hypothetical protein
VAASRSAQIHHDGGFVACSARHVKLRGAQIPLISLYFLKKTAGGRITAAESLTFWSSGNSITARIFADIRCNFAVNDCLPHSLKAL